MKNTDTGKSKIQKICDIIKLETIEPAQQEAREIIENAHMKAKEIIKSAEKQVEEMLHKASHEIEHKKRVFDSSLSLACRQSMEALRQKIENELFNSAVSDMTKKGLSQNDAIVKIINAIVEAIERGGIDADLTAYVGKAVSAKEISEQLLSKVLERLREKGVVVGDFPAGVKIRMHNMRITIDLSDEALKELVGSFVRKEFREMLCKV